MPQLNQTLNIYIKLSGKEAEEVKIKLDKLKLTYREIFLNGLETLFKKLNPR